jgi:hypothetical protein
MLLKNRLYGAIIAALFIGFSASSLHAQTTLLVSDSNGGNEGSGNKIVRFEYPSGEPIGYFSTDSFSPIDNTTGIAQGPDGDIYVGSYETSSVQRYAAETGKYLGEFIAPNYGGLTGPIALDFGPDGNLYVSSTVTDSVKRYNGTTGVYMDEISIPGGGVRNFAFSPNDGLIYIALRNLNRVDRFNPVTGQFIDVLGFGMTLAQNITFNETGDIYITTDEPSNNRMFFYYADNFNTLPGDPQVFGSQYSFIIGLNRPLDLVIDDDGAMLIVERPTGKVGKYVHLTKFNPLPVFVENVVDSNEGNLDGGYGLLLYDHNPPVEPDCLIDFNNDGNLDIFDVLEFVSRYKAGCP